MSIRQYLQNIPELPIGYTKSCRFEDARSSKLFALLFKENVRNHPTLSKGSQVLLQALLSSLVDSPFVFGVDKRKYLREIGLCPRRTTKFDIYLTEAVEAGFVQIMKRRAGTKNNYALMCIPLNWDCHALCEALDKCEPDVR